MKKSVFLLLLVLSSCNKTGKDNTSDSETNKQQDASSQNEESVNNIKYVNAVSGLNYRAEPNGKVVGKLKHNTEVKVIEHTNIFTEIKDNNKRIKGEWLAIEMAKDTVYVFDAFLSINKNDTGVWAKFPLRKQPFIDSTNFDNISKNNKLNSYEIAKLKLSEIYPEFDKEGYDYMFYPSYKLNFKNFRSIVVNVFKGDSELESVLISYDLENNLMKSYNENNKLDTNARVIAYDEIAEGWSRITSKIKNNTITTIAALYIEPPVIDTILYHINRGGYINKVNTKFKNNIRLNKTIKLHTIYTDTIQFTAYNDNTDYFYLEGKKDDKKVSLIYNWDWNNEGYNFKKDDLIKIKWKMDSIYIAGDGETLDFSEFAIDAEKIEE